MHQTQFSEKIPYGGFSQIRSHLCTLYYFIQVKPFQSKGVKAAFVGKDQTDEPIKSGIVAGDYSLVYMSPESMLTNLKYREMF